MPPPTRINPACPTLEPHQRKQRIAPPRYLKRSLNSGMVFGDDCSVNKM